MANAPNCSEPKLSLSPLYPPSLLKERLEVYDAFWSGEDIGRPIFVPIPWRNEPFDGCARRTPLQVWFDRQRRRAASPVDALPFFSTGVGGTVALASAFGGAVQFTPDGKAWIEPVVANPGDAARLEPPPVTAGFLGRGLANYKEALERLDMFVPPQVPDMQGPLQTAAFLWHQEQFIYAMYDEPEAVHRTLDIVTDYIIRVIAHFRDAFPDAEMAAYPPSHLPRRMGCAITEDFMHLLSPELYEEFGLPYVNRISDAFGGVFVHCCGRFRQHWPVVRKIHNLRGLDTMYPYTDPAEIYEAFPDIVHSCGLDYAETQRNFKDKGPDAWLEYLVARTPRHVRWQFVTECDNADTVPRQLELVRRKWAPKVDAKP